MNLNLPGDDEPGVRDPPFSQLEEVMEWEREVKLESSEVEERRRRRRSREMERERERIIPVPLPPRRERSSSMYAPPMGGYGYVNGYRDI